MNHRLQAPSTQTPFHIYYPFISPASYLPAITAQPDGQISSKSRAPFPTSVSTHQPQKSNFSISRILQTVPPLAAVGSNDVISSSYTARSSEDVMSPAATISVHQQSLIDTAAKMLWLQQMANAQHHPILSRQAVCDHKKVAKKRKLGRNPRIPFTQQQIELLERRYSNNRYLSSLDVVELSKNLELSEARVKIWFQNRRARARRDEKLNKCLPSSSLNEGGTYMLLHAAAASSSPIVNTASHEPTSSDMTMWRSSSASIISINDSLKSEENRGRNGSPVCKLEILSDTD